ncbi:MAG: head-tail adaptor protein [Methanogenium sp.]|jgi:hypothetical protein
MKKPVLASELKHRIRIQSPIEVPDEVSGALLVTYITEAECWSALKNESSYLTAVRGQTQDGTASVVFKIRMNSVSNIGPELTKAFSNAFKNIQESNTIKSNWFILLKKGNDWIKGRRFRIEAINRDEIMQEWINIRAKEIEEIGVGYSGV